MKTPDKQEIENTLNNIATPEVAKKVMRWFSSPNGRKFLENNIDFDLNNITEEDIAEFTDHDIPSDKMHETIMRHIRKLNRRRFFMTAAAIILPLILIIGIYVELNSHLDLFAKTEYEEIIVPNKQQIQFMFQDGSRVYLNSGTRLRYPKKFGLKERKVEIEGEGFFEITENKKRPFIVDMHAINIKVLGTTFDTKAYTDEKFITIALESGNIEVNSNKFSTFNVNPGERVIYNRTTGTYEIIRPGNIESYSAWRTNKLHFKDTPLSEVITTLSRTFDVTFHISDNAVLNYSFTLYTENNNIDFILQELEKIAPISFEKKDEIVYVKIKSES